MILKIIIFASLITVIYFKFFKKPLMRKPKEEKKNRTKTNEEVMVECLKCGTYTSNKEAIIKDGSYYCSKECANVTV